MSLLVILICVFVFRDMGRTTGCLNKSAIFNFAIKAPFIQKVLIFLFRQKVHTLRLIVEHYVQQTSLTTLLNRGGRQCAHFKSCSFVGTPHTLVTGTGILTCDPRTSSAKGCILLVWENFKISSSGSFLIHRPAKLKPNFRETSSYTVKILIYLSVCLW